MNIPTNLLIFLLLFSFASCDKFWEVKRSIRLAIMGQSVEDALEEVEEEPEEEVKVKGSKRISEITEQSKLFNLMREFTTSGDETFVQIIIKQIPLVSGEFSGPYNETLVSSLQRFVGPIENRNESATKIIVQWYKSLNGKNKAEAGKVLALNFDYNVKNFFKNHNILVQNDGCRMSLMLPPRVQGNAKSVEYLTARRDKLKKLMDGSQLQGYSETVAQQCLALMRERINLFKNSKTDLN